MRKLPTLRWLLLTLVLSWSLPGAAQAWPQKTVQIIDPYGPGSATDLVDRLIADKLQKRTGQPFIVMSRPGAGGLIGSTEIARAKPDGYTFGLAPPGPLATGMLMRKSMPYDTLHDFAPLTLAVHQPMLLTASKSIGANTLSTLIAEVKKHPKKYNYAFVGIGSLSHLLMIRLLETSGMALEPVSYPRGSEAMMAVMRGDAQLVWSPASVALPQVKAGKVILLGVSSAHRSPLLPDAPTMVEQGFPDVVGTAWIAAVAPANVPKPQLNTMSQMIVEALREPDVVETLGKAMIEVIAGSPAQYDAAVREEILRWEPVIKRHNIVID